MTRRHRHCVQARRLFFTYTMATIQPSFANAAKFFNSLLEALDREDHRALLFFMDFCFQQRRDVPPWAQKMFSAAVGKARDFEIKSWGEVFGRPLAKGGQLDKQRRKDRALARVWALVNKRRRAGEPRSKALFEAVGRELSIGGATVVEEMYDKVLREFRERPEGYALIRSPNPGYPIKHLGRAGQMRTTTILVKDTFEPPFDPQDKPPRKD
jgi:hypothetical protein